MWKQIAQHWWSITREAVKLWLDSNAFSHAGAAVHAARPYRNNFFALARNRLLSLTVVLAIGFALLVSAVGAPWCRGTRRCS